MSVETNPRTTAQADGNNQTDPTTCETVHTEPAAPDWYRPLVMDSEPRMTRIPLIHHDFMGEGDEQFYYLQLTPFGGFDRLWWASEGNPMLQEGMPIRLYSFDPNREGEPDILVAEGTVHRLLHDREWYAHIPRRQIGHFSELGTDPAHWAHGVDWAEVRNREIRFDRQLQVGAEQADEHR
jgi:hypothetical protein